MFVFETHIRVRYAETDQMGYMYYGNYAAFYEVARTEMLRSLGMTYSSMEKDGIMLPVAELKTKYLKPALYDENIRIKVSIHQKPSVRIVFHYELFNEKQTKIFLFLHYHAHNVCGPVRRSYFGYANFGTLLKQLHLFIIC